MTATTVSAAGEDTAMPDRDPRPSAEAPPLWLSEAIVGTLVLIVALVAWVSLIFTDLSAYSLARVLGTAGAVVVVAVVGTVLARVVRRRRAPRPDPGAEVTTTWKPEKRRLVRADPGGLAMVALLAAVTGMLFFPGFHYGAADKDPGGYVAQAMAIPRTGSYLMTDPAGGPGRLPPVEQSSAGSRFPGIWILHGDKVILQFYVLWPALMAVAYDLGGTGALVNVGPFCGLLAVCCLALAVRRALAGALGGGARAPAAPQATPARRGLVGQIRAVALAAEHGLRDHAAAAGVFAGLATGLVLGTDMLEVWQAKYPSSEISAQLFFTATLLGIVMALTTGAWQPAAAAGVLTGVGFLDRADGVLTVLLAAAGGAALVAVRRFDRRALAFALGLVAVLPHALWQAYSPDASQRYTLENNVPTLTKVIAAVVALFVVGFVARLVLGWWTRRRAASRGRHGLGPEQRARRVQFVLGVVAVVAVTGLCALGLLRSRLFGADYAYFAAIKQDYRTYDEQSLQRIGWFISLPAYPLALLGIAVVALRRWSAALWVIAVSTVPLFALYAWHTHNSVRMMWWARRYVPTALPGILALVGVAIGVFLVGLISRKLWSRIVLGVPALVVLAGLLYYTLPQSLPLRDHDEMKGSFEITAELAALSGGHDGVYLWQRQNCCFTAVDMFPAALWLGRGQLSALMPQDTKNWPTYVGSFVKEFPDSPVFVISPGAAKPDNVGSDLTVEKHFVTSIPVWEESEISRPSHANSVPVDFTVWRVAGT